ncbi:hypothetical protein BpHYR1_028776 [Brachionus plicatilis]|uniref:Uncharacterized protein n=1 Tax=Brachionus plicatilis TaxID=10195 RepID=A0A3M7RSW3_BRAPC|nr:hypothetical protein BpHYR1_028776 [Brachionus plicatilis]
MFSIHFKLSGCASVSNFINYFLLFLKWDLIGTSKLSKLNLAQTYLNGGTDILEKKKIRESSYFFSIKQLNHISLHIVLFTLLKTSIQSEYLIFDYNFDEPRKTLN